MRLPIVFLRSDCLYLSALSKELNLLIVNEKSKAKSNAEVRRWYLEQVTRISELNRQWIAQELPARERAKAAWHIRHETRLEARAMMASLEEVELLRQRDIAEYGNPDGPTFEFLVEKLKDAGLEEDAIYEAIIDGSYRTNAGVNRRLGI